MMTVDEYKKLSSIYDKMKEAAYKSAGPLHAILLPWIKELHDILEPYEEYRRQD